MTKKELLEIKKISQLPAPKGAGLLKPIWPDH